MAKMEEFEQSFSVLAQLGAEISADVAEIGTDVEFLLEQLTHVNEGLTAAQEADVLGRLNAVRDRLVGIKASADAVAGKVTPPTEEPQPEPEPEDESEPEPSSEASPSDGLVNIA